MRVDHSRLSLNIIDLTMNSLNHLYTSHLPPPALPDYPQDLAPLKTIPRRFGCKYDGCGRSFSTSGHLTRHNKIHTGEKIHFCPILNCASKFSRRDNMNQHFVAHQKKLLLNDEKIQLKEDYQPLGSKQPSKDTKWHPNSHKDFATRHNETLIKEQRRAMDAQMYTDQSWLITPTESPVPFYDPKAEDQSFVHSMHPFPDYRPKPDLDSFIEFNGIARECRPTQQPPIENALLFRPIPVDGYQYRSPNYDGFHGYYFPPNHLE